MSTQMFTPAETIIESNEQFDANNIHVTQIDNVPDKYDLELCVDWIKTRGLEKVCLQFPDHLLPDSTNIGLYLKKRLKRDVYILGDTSYGSCCIDDVAAKHIDADGIVHFGHACLSPTTRLPVLHIFEKNPINIDQFCNAFQSRFPDCSEKIILFYDVSYSHAIHQISTTLMNQYKNLIVTKLNCTSNCPDMDAKEQNSVILGRCYELESNSKISDYQAVFIGSNEKTMMNLALSIGVSTWNVYDCGNGKLEQVSLKNTQWIKRRRFLIEKLKDAKTVGIVVATLGIKDYLKAISFIKQALKKVNKKSYILSVGKINPAKLANFSEMDAFIVIACPESEIFDSKDFFKPLLMPYEVDMAFNSGRELSSHYCMDFRQILDGGSNYVEFQGASEETDVSLITGNLRNFAHDDDDDNSASKMNAITCKATGTVAIGSSGANFLVERSWQGLEQRLGEDEIQKTVEKGRSGLPINYQNEPNLCT